METGEIVAGASDVTLVSGDGKEFKCQRMVLSEQSSYFNTMFNSNYVESSQQSITLHNISGPLLGTLIDFSYGKPIEADEGQLDFYMDLLEMATVFQFSSVKDRCIKVLARNLCVRAAVDVFLLAETHGLTRLSESALSYLSFHFFAISIECPHSLTRLPYDVLLKILKSVYGRDIRSELKMLETIDNWVQHYGKSDSSLVADDEKVLTLLCCVRLHLFSAHDWLQLSSLSFVRNSSLLSNAVSALTIAKKCNLPLLLCHCACHRDCTNALNSERHASAGTSTNDSDITLPVRRGERPNSRITPSCSCSSGYSTRHQNNTTSFPEQNVMLNESLEADSKFLCPKQVCCSQEIFSLAKNITGRATRKSPPHAPCVIGHVRRDDIPTTGPSQKSSTASVLMFCLKSGKFRNLLHIEKIYQAPIEASGYKACAIGKDIYLFGGEYMLGHSNWNNAVWRWDRLTSSWHYETALRKPRRHHSTCVQEPFIYLIGGYGKHRIVLDSMEQYDATTKRWKDCAKLPIPFFGCAFCCHLGLVYAFGQNQIFAYDPRLDEWRNICKLTTPNSITFTHAMSIESTGHIYLTSSHSNTLYRLHPLAPSPSLESLGTFQNTVLNCCFVDTLNLIFVFSSSSDTSADEISSSLKVETFDVDANTFSVVWEQESVNDSLSICDFGSSNLGCFPFVSFE